MRAATFIFGIVLTILLSVKANAVVHEPGTFVANECGAQNLMDAAYLVDIDQVCFGKIIINGDQGSVPGVQFKLTSGKAVNFRIVSSTAMSGVPSIPGIQRYSLKLMAADGEVIEMKVVRSQDGRIRSAFGQLDVIRYQVQDFEQVYSATGMIDAFEADEVPDYFNLPDNDFQL